MPWLSFSFCSSAQAIDLPAISFCWTSCARFSDCCPRWGRGAWLGRRTVVDERLGSHRGTNTFLWSLDDFEIPWTVGNTSCHPIAGYQRLAWLRDITVDSNVAG